MVKSTTIIKRRLAAMSPILLVVTYEEDRAVEGIVELASKSQQKYNSVWVWTFGVGTKQVWCRTTPVAGKMALLTEHKDSPMLPLAFAQEKGQGTGRYRLDNSLLILKDFGYFLNGSGGFAVGRAMKELAVNLTKERPGGDFSAVIILDSEADLPDRLTKLVHTVDFDLPTKEEIIQEFTPLLTQAIPNIKEPEVAAAATQLAQSTVGLTMLEISSALSMSLAVHGHVNPQMLLSEKKSIIRNSGVLEYLDTTTDLDDVGGLGNLKDWLRVRSNAFGEAAQKFGLPAPKGALLLGVPGVGKTLIAKSIGRTWNVPVVKLDVGALFGSLVGESEGRLRKALKTLDAIAPVVCFVDELEKALGHGGLDGGTSTRVFGGLLSYLSDKTSAVFMVCTANDISSLPPELLRAGRFDATFFIDLPSEAERKEVADVVIRRNNRSQLLINTTAIASASPGFSGAELESTFVAALYAAFYSGTEVTTSSWVNEISRAVPLSTTMQEELIALRAWAVGRTISATRQESIQISKVPLRRISRLAVTDLPKDKGDKAN